MANERPRKYTSTENRIVRIRDERLFKSLDTIAENQDMCLQDVFDDFCKSMSDMKLSHLMRSFMAKIGGYKHEGKE